MDRNQIALPIEAKHITGIKLFATHSTNFTVYQNFLALDNSLSHTTGFYGICKFQRRFQLNELCSDNMRKIILFFLVG